MEDCRKVDAFLQLWSGVKASKSILIKHKGSVMLLNGPCTRVELHDCAPFVGLHDDLGESDVSVV